MITNAQFIQAVFPNVPEGGGGWIARRADLRPEALEADSNNFVGCSSFYPGDDGSFRARKGSFAACHFLMLDDLGTKVPLERLGNFELSWLIETSPGNFQGGIILEEPLTDGDAAARLLDAVIEAGLCDAGAATPMTRWARLPVAINGKAKHFDEAGNPFQCRMVEWRPDCRYTPQEIVERLQLELVPAGHQQSPLDQTWEAPSNVLIPRPPENPVIEALKTQGLYKTQLGPGKHDVTCPWVREHTDELDTGAAYFEPDEFYPLGGFSCLHSHRDKYHVRELLGHLDVPATEAQHKPVIRIVVGELDRVVDAAEKELAGQGQHYQAGGLIVSVATDPTTGDPSIVPTTLPALTRELSVAASWERFNKQSQDWSRCDPPERHARILFDARKFNHLLPLAGVARQPYFRESDGELITQPGYDSKSQRFSVFDPDHFVIPGVIENPNLMA